ncbi:putative hemin transport protein [Dyadobacter sp. BE34]|uniref:Hemin transport protein n=1 Tax=Dyadobacter fermentans TaxID=94254 RepID=A0ABU1R2S9_9BACT|nr:MULTISPECIES: ChuX/HutX family heme-like substrate-binding protein [Dyadobacter]MDR6807719.1 putative hemin transport protein [Dyadobacter fermentans]MDR7045460.1 putative hemin transport protein [Dyadobacter sp. BE242]MDR7199773.1 putative hemin transport protein [Dyadobacter sp. BE34]MDR7217768.1 putative hemin transport protein [Dyadobacter sp. BE31]MDR7265664.1 putative hemin transport protein [Dyadobacter sp. BE32]
MKSTLSPDRTELKERWAEYKLANPKSRIRDDAKALGTSEAELLATGLGSHVQLLDGDFRELIKEMGSLGHVMALTRNDHVVHERKGVYEKISFNNHVGLVLGEDIDLRLFLGDWKFGFAVSENERYSLQFFNSFGEAAHKIYLTEKSDKKAYDALVTKYLATDQDVNLFVTEKKEKVAEPDEVADFDQAVFQQEWLALKDTHDFFTLLRKHKLSRKQALRNAPEGYAHRIKPESMKPLFDAISETRLPIMVFVSNPNCIQIHTGPIKKIFVMGPWLNVMDPEFNLHLREDAIDEAWVVQKPTEDGIVTGIELIDKDGVMFNQFFGKRKPGIPELAEWPALIELHSIKF